MDCTFIEKIGKGAYGEVWKGVCQGKTVAIKVFSDLNEWQNEYFNLKQIKKVCDPYALCLLGQYTKDNKGYVVTNLVNGPTFLSALAGNSLEKRQSYSQPMFDLVKGLALIHNAGVVHLDIKGSNIMMDDHFRYIDFGYGCRKGVYDCIATGSVYSAAPTTDLEQPYSWEEGMSFDVWSLGVMLLRWYSMEWDPEFNMKLAQNGTINDRSVVVNATSKFYPAYSDFSPDFLDYIIRTIPNTGVRSVVGILLVRDPVQRNVNFEFAQKILNNSVNIAEETSSDVLEIADALIQRLVSRDVDNVIPTIDRIMSLQS